MYVLPLPVAIWIRAGAGCRRGSFQVLDALHLDAPKTLRVERRHLPQQRTHLIVELDQANQFFGTMEGEDFPAAGIGFQGIGEVRYSAGGFVGERQGQAVMRQLAGRPSLYLADCVSTPVSVCPSGLASTTPTALPSAYSK